MSRTTGKRLGGFGGAAAIAVICLLLAPGTASAAQNDELVEEQTYTHRFDESWGSGEVETTVYDDRVEVEASDVRADDGCVKLKYKVDRRTTWLVPVDAPQVQRDSVGDLARDCADDNGIAAEGRKSVTLNADAVLHDVSFEFCRIKQFRGDECVTVVVPDDVTS